MGMSVWFWGVTRSAVYACTYGSVRPRLCRGLVCKAWCVCVCVCVCVKTCTGCIYEYTVEDAGAKAEPSLAKRTAKLQKQVAARAAELRAIARGNSYFQPPPGA